MKTIRLYMAEILMKWALDLMPDSKEKVKYSQFLLKYSEGFLNESNRD